VLLYILADPGLTAGRPAGVLVRLMQHILVLTITDRLRPLTTPWSHSSRSLSLPAKMSVPRVMVVPFALIGSAEEGSSP